MKTAKILIKSLAIKQNNYIVMVKTSDLIDAGYGHLTLGNYYYTFVNKSWIKPFTKNTAGLIC